MKIKLTQEEGIKEVELQGNAQIISLIKQMKLNDETFLIKLNGKIAHEEEQLKEGDELEFLNVIYGG